MSQRCELVAMASAEGVSIAELARRFGVSRKTVYKWLDRHRRDGQAALADRSRRPHRCPHRTPEAVERRVLALRAKHPRWGGRKLHHRLRRLGVEAPAPSTITRILREHGLVAPAASAQRRRWRRFERAAPNELWQMDFKGPVGLVGSGSCHPLTVIDDHSRYALGLRACADQRQPTVRQQLVELFERYGLPWAVLSDNGSPWRAPAGNGLTRLELWLMRLDVAVVHGRPFHPQTQGKDERFHRTLEAEVLGAARSAIGRRCRRRSIRGGRCTTTSGRTRRWRWPRRRSGIGPASGRCRVCCRRSRTARAGGALAGESVALRPTVIDGVWSVYYGRFPIGRVDLRAVGPGRFAHVLSPGFGRCAPCAGAEHVDAV